MDGAKSIKGTENLLFTEILVSENTYYKGNSSNSHLFDSILQLCVLEMTAEIISHLIHMAGTRIKECGIDYQQYDYSDGIARVA